MRNKYKPFFYDKKKTSARKIFLILAICIGAFLFYGFQIPGIRQIISEPLYAAWSYSFNSFRLFINATRMYHEPPAPVQTYTPLEFPDKEVLFAESLESLSDIAQADPLADLRQTPTPSTYSRVAEWEYLDPNLNYSINAGDHSNDDNIAVRLIPPVFEHADLFNDGAAILSAALRFWGEVENQYRISSYVHSDPRDPVIHFSDLESFILDAYPDYSVIIRMNGNKDLLISLLKNEIPVIIRIQSKHYYSFWPRDDRIFGKFILLHGYDSKTDSFFFSDAINSNTEEISSEELLADWYPFQRRYFLIFPKEKDDIIRESMSENYYEELNLQSADAKFKTDSELLENNPFSQYNYGVVLYKSGDYTGSLEYFRKAAELSLPHRYLNYQPEMFETLLRLGFADDLSEMTDELLKRNSHDDILTVYRGWASLLRGDLKEAGEFFDKAGKINPRNETVLYALKYKETMIQ